MNKLYYEQELHNKITEAFAKPKTVTAIVDLRTLAYQLGLYGPYDIELSKLTAFNDLSELDNQAVKISFNDGLQDWQSDFLSNNNDDMASMSEDIMDKRRMNHTPDISQAEIDDRRMNDDVY